ncbi:hypothetical protein RFI_29243, partial [Reticulomyxa filosa]
EKENGKKKKIKKKKKKQQKKNMIEIETNEDEKDKEKKKKKGLKKKVDIGDSGDEDKDNDNQDYSNTNNDNDNNDNNNAKKSKKTQIISIKEASDADDQMQSDAFTVWGCNYCSPRTQVFFCKCFAIIAISKCKMLFCCGGDGLEQYEETEDKNLLGSFPTNVSEDVFKHVPFPMDTLPNQKDKDKEKEKEKAKEKEKEKEKRKEQEKERTQEKWRKKPDKEIMSNELECLTDITGDIVGETWWDWQPMVVHYNYAQNRSTKVSSDVWLSPLWNDTQHYHQWQTQAGCLISDIEATRTEIIKTQIVELTKMALKEWEDRMKTHLASVRSNLKEGERDIETEQLSTIELIDFLPVVDKTNIRGNETEDELRELVSVLSSREHIYENDNDDSAYESAKLKQEKLGVEKAGGGGSGVTKKKNKDHGGRSSSSNGLLSSLSCFGTAPPQRLMEGSRVDVIDHHVLDEYQTYFRKYLSFLLRLMPKYVVIQPEEWKEDELVQQCNACNVEFSTLNRRHHCRMCGNIQCHDCQKLSNALRIGYNHPTKICLSCYERIPFYYAQAWIEFIHQLVDRPDFVSFIHGDDFLSTSG